MSNIEILKFDCGGMKNGSRFPVKNTGRGDDLSPVFTFYNLSDDAKTIAITLDDLDVPFFDAYNHWVIWNISAQKSIPEGIPHGETVPSLGNAVQGIGYGRHRYSGPKPPQGKRHRYQFNIYVLNSEISLDGESHKKVLLKAIEPFVIQHGTVTGVFE